MQGNWHNGAQGSGGGGCNAGGLAIQSQIEWRSDRVREFLTPGIKPLGMARER